MARLGWFKQKSTPPGMVNAPKGIAAKCPSCGEILLAGVLERNLEVCPRCGSHHRLPARRRIELTADPDTFVEMDAHLIPSDPLGFPDYRAKQQSARRASGLSEAIVTGVAEIGGHPTVLGVADFSFIGGSMGSVVGEKIVRAVERAIADRLPVVMFTASGGARMHEGLVALMQMAKTSAATRALANARLPFIVVLTDPTTGGVLASYASLGDVTLAEPSAVVGFAGRRVGNQDVGVRLPDNFQTSEFQLEHGLIDRITPRKEIRPVLTSLLGFFAEDVR